MTHYERLGVRPTATAAEIRDAYRAAARSAHPDRNGDASSVRMAAVNESYRVLRDPDRRRAYDLSLDVSRASGGSNGRTAPRSSASTSAPTVPPWSAQDQLQPARFPWRFMAVMLALGVGLVAVGVALGGTTPATPIDNVLRSGDCVELSDALEAREVRCDAPFDATVHVLVPFDATCPTGTEPYRDRQGMGTACVIRAPGSPRAP